MIVTVSSRRPLVGRGPHLGAPLGPVAHRRELDSGSGVFRGPSSACRSFEKNVLRKNIDRKADRFVVRSYDVSWTDA